MPPQNSQKTMRAFIVVGLLLGLLLLAGLGVYAAVQYFELSSTLGGANPTPPPTKIPAESAEKPTASSAPSTIPAGQAETATAKSPTPAVAADLAATATAACGLFLSQFPGTPCPAEAVPGIEMTATAACATFRSQFPGTPCP
jgi:hypothetical protein